jgi:hypothetical protein
VICCEVPNCTFNYLQPFHRVRERLDFGNAGLLVPLLAGDAFRGPPGAHSSSGMARPRPGKWRPSDMRCGVTKGVACALRIISLAHAATIAHSFCCRPP